MTGPPPPPAPPAVLAVDPDPGLLRSLLAELRRHLPQLQVFGCLNEADATTLLGQLAGEGVEVAIVLCAVTLEPAEHHGRHSTGREAGGGPALLARSRRWFPTAKRVLLGDALDEQVQQALTAEVAHDVVGRPWAPAAVTLIPVLEDLLAEWASLHRPVPEQIVVVGDGGPSSHRLRDLFSRNPVPHRYLDLDDPEAAELVGRHGAAGQLPLIVTPDGVALRNPSPAQLWAALGERTTSLKDTYELLIVGAGPAGLAAAVAAASEGIDTLVVEPVAPGGQAGSSSRIENYVGFPGGITGTEIGRRAYLQALRLGAESIGPQRVTELARHPDGTRLTATFDSGQQVTADVVLLTTGVSWNRLDAPGAEQFESRGLFYGAATAEARFANGKDVHVVGGANSAGQAALFFARVAHSVTLLVRGTSLEMGMSRYLIDRLHALDNVNVFTSTTLTALDGTDEQLRRLRLRDTETGRERWVESAAVFTFIGARPDTGWLPPDINRDANGFVLSAPTDPVGSGASHATSMPGVYAAGDVRDGSIKRVSSAVGDGSSVVPEIHAYLAQLAAIQRAGRS